MPRGSDGISRRGLLSVPIQVAVSRLAEAAQRAHENLECRAGRLWWSGGSARAAIGRAGIRSSKREGDGATPAGTYPLVCVLYRRDRIAPPTSHRPVRPLAQHDGWVDEPSDANYNRLVELPYPARAEQMWREDNLYDALVVIGYNMEPVIPGAGSAIFLHIATPEFAATAGCVAVDREVLLNVIALLGPGSRITISP
jgi:L,D-peptidoglycan transpeptidase YkuD (ErfK/YbiS/YcfS/YnhG family)